MATVLKTQQTRLQQGVQPIRAAIYLRISRDDEKLGNGVARQLPRCRAELERLGWAEAVVFNENDTSATRKKPRPKYQQMLAMVRAGELDAVIGYAQDRLTRKQREAEDLIDLFDSMGMQVAIAGAGALRLDNPDARAAFRQATTGGAREVDWIKKRTRDEAEQRAHSGRANGPAPFGWARHVELSKSGAILSTQDVIDPEEAAALQRAAKRLLSGVSLGAVTAELEAGSVRPRRAAHWRTGQVRWLLLRPANVRQRVFRGEVLEGVTADWPAILDDVTYALVCQLLNDPTRRSNEKGSTPAWLLSGIATCGRCADGGRIRVHLGGSGKLKRPAYSCMGCFQRHWVADIDPYVAGLVSMRLADPSLADVGPEAYAELAALYAARDALKAEQTQATEMVTSGAITLAQLGALNVSYTKRLADVDAQIASVLPSMAATVDLVGGWDAAGLPEKRAAVRVLFREVVLMPAALVSEHRREPFNPSHVVTVRWDAQ